MRAGEVERSFGAGVSLTLAFARLTDSERRLLRRRAAGLEGSTLTSANRARIVLATAGGLSDSEIAAALEIDLGTVRRWQQRFATEGLRGLDDRPRSGAPRSIGPTTILQVARAAFTGSGASTRTVADETGVSCSTVARVWKRYHLDPSPLVVVDVAGTVVEHPIGDLVWLSVRGPHVVFGFGAAGEVGLDRPELRLRALASIGSLATDDATPPEEPVVVPPAGTVVATGNAHMAGRETLWLAEPSDWVRMLQRWVLAPTTDVETAADLTGQLTDAPEPRWLWWQKAKKSIRHLQVLWLDAACGALEVSELGALTALGLA